MKNLMTSLEFVKKAKAFYQGIFAYEFKKMKGRPASFENVQAEYIDPFSDYESDTLLGILDSLESAGIDWDKDAIKLGTFKKHAFLVMAKEYENEGF